MFEYWVGAVLLVLAITIAIIVPKRRVRGIEDSARRLELELHGRNSILQIVGGAFLLGGLVFTSIELDQSRIEAEADRAVQRLAIEAQTEGFETQASVQRESTAAAADRQHDLLEAQAESLRAQLDIQIRVERQSRYVALVAQLGQRDGIHAAAIESLQRLAQEDPETLEAQVKVAIAAFARSGDRTKFNALNFSGVDLRFAYLAGAELKFAKLVKTDLSNARLTGARLNDADLTGAQLTNADLQGAVFKRANLEKANFRYAKLSNANFEEARIDYADFKSSDVTQSQIKQACRHYYGAGAFAKLPNGFDPPPMCDD